jgi:hypothetical protein
MAVGLNLDPIDFYSTALMFNDAMKYANDGWQVARASSPSVTIAQPGGLTLPQFDQNGYPIGLGNLAAQGYALTTFTLHNGQHYPTGTYQLIFDGKGTVAIDQGNANITTVTQGGGPGTPNPITVASTTGLGLYVAILASDPTDYVRNVRLIMPGYQDTYQTQPFYTPFLQDIQPFTGPLRFMDTMQTNGQPSIDWSQRTTTTYMTQTKSTGVALEYLVALADTAGKDMWVNMPAQATDAYVQNFAQYVHDHLNPGLKVYVEYGNEVWNSGGGSVFLPAWQYVDSYAQAHGLNHDQATADLASHDWSLWSAVYGSQTGSTFLRVAADQFAVPWSLDQEIQRLVAGAAPGDPHHGFDIISGAPYYAPDPTNYTSATTTAQIVADTQATLPALDEQLVQFLAIRSKWQQALGQTIPVMMYEGGFGMSPHGNASVPWYQAFLGTQTDPGMYQVTAEFLSRLAQEGVDGLNYYAYAVPPNSWGAWGAKQYTSEPASQTPKYDALTDWTTGVLSVPAVAKLSVTGLPSKAAAGKTTTITVTALDPNGNVATGYLGLVQFSSTDPQAVLPADYAFTATDAGTHTFTVTLATAGTQTLTVADPGQSALTATLTEQVNPAWFDHFAMTCPLVAPTGYAATLRLVAQDPFGNTVTAYRGPVHFTSTDPKAILPADYTFTAADAGVHTFAASYYTTGYQTVAAADTAAFVTAKSKLLVTTPGASGASQLLTSGPSALAAGTTWTLTVTAANPYGTAAIGYKDTVHFTTSDLKAVLPADYTFTAADAGVHTFTVTLKTAGAQWVKVADTANGPITGTAPVAVNPGPLDRFDMYPFPNAWTAGVPQGFTATASDAYGNVLAGYAGTAHFTSTDPKAALPADYTFTAADAGSHAFAATMFTAGSYSLRIGDTQSGVSTGYRRPTNPGPAALFAFAGPSAATAGTAQALTMTAYDAYGNVATGYTGTVHFTSTDPQAALPADYTFTAADAGVHALNVALFTAGAQAVTAADTANGPVAGSAGLAISAAAPAGLIVAGPSAATAGTARGFTVTAVDAYGNTASTYTGTVHFTSTDPQTALPANSTFTAADAGAHTFSIALLTAGAQTVTIADTVSGGFTCAAGVAVTAAAASRLATAGFAAATTAGVAQTFAVTAYDPYNNVATGYTGKVHFTSTDPQATLPADYTFTAADAGAHTFTAALATAGTQALTAADTSASGVAGSQPGIAVSPAAPAGLIVAGPAASTAGATQILTVAAYDAYGNVATGYFGTVNFTSTDAQAALPADYTFTAADAGRHAFAVTLFAAGAQAVTAADAGAVGSNAVGGGFTSTAAMSITAAAANRLVVGGFTTFTTAGVAQTFAVTAYDLYNNVATGYTGKVHFTSTDPQAALPADYTFTAADAGAHTFTAALKTAGTQALTAADTSASGVAGSQPSIAVAPAGPAGLAVAGSPAATAGTTQVLTVTVCDAYGNATTGYLGTVHFASTDPQAALPADYTFTIMDAGRHAFTVTLKTAGAKTITAADKVNSIFPGTTGVAVAAAAARRLGAGGFPASATAGAPQTLTVTAYDVYGNVATGYTGTVHFTSTDAQAVLPANYTFTAGDAGTRAFTAALKTVGVQAFTVTDTVTSNFTASEAGIAVTPAAASRLAVAGFPAATTAGFAQTFAVTAYDPYNNVAAGYAGTVHFTSTDAQAALPADYTFTATDAGRHTFGAALKTAGAEAIAATDAANHSVTGTQPAIAVAPAAPAGLAIAGLPAATAGLARGFTVMAVDAYGNTAPAYTGKIHFTSGDPQAILPANYTFTAADAGSHSFAITLKTAGTQTVTVADTKGTFAGSEGVPVAAAAGSRLTLGGFPTPTQAGAVQALTVTAYDPYNNVATGYTGTAHFTSNDPQANLPADYTFTAADAGVHTLTAVLKQAGTRSITATDAVNAALKATQANIVVVAAPVARFSLYPYPSSWTAGVGQGFTVLAQDAYGNIVPSYAGTAQFTSNDPRALLPASYTFTAADAGKHAFAATMITAGWHNLAVADANGVSASSNRPTSPAAPAGFVVAGPAAATAGTAQVLTVTAVDAYGNTAPTYAGSIHFISTDMQAVLPANYTFTAADAGVHTFIATLKTAGAQALAATDTVNGAMIGSGPIAVAAASASRLTLAGLAGSATAGAAQGLTVTTYDVYGNVATGYTGTVHFTSTDAQAALPADYTFTAADAGARTFTTALKTAGAQALAATDTVNGALASSASIAVSPAAAAGLVLAGPAASTAGAAQVLTLTVYDAYGNVATAYAGTVHFTSTDAQAALPADYTFAPSDTGAHAFIATLKTAGAQAVTATDAANGAITGSQPGIAVGPAAPASLVVAGPSASTAGTAQALTVTVVDAYGNTTPAYLGTVHFTSTDAQAAPPADYTFTPADAGAHTFAVTLETAGTQALTATDTTNGTINGAASIAVSAAAASRLVLAGFAASATAGAAQAVTVTTYDVYGNIATGYAGTVHFTSTDAQAALPASYTFTAADAGAHTFTAALKTAGAQTLTAVDTANGNLASGLPGIAVSPAAPAGLMVAGPAASTAGAAQALTVTVVDAYGNTTPTYAGTVHFNSTDVQAILPADYTFTAADAGVHAFTAALKTAGAEAVTAADAANGAIAGSAPIGVSAASANRLALAGFTSPTTAGAAQALAVTAYDVYGNIATAYAGTVHFTSTDAQAALPADYAFTPADAGAHIFTVALKTVGTRSIAVADTVNAALKATQASIAVVAAAAAHFNLYPYPTSWTAGTAQSFTITAQDAYGNTVITYAGTVQFSSTDPRAVLPAPYTFRAADAGKHAFSATMIVAGWHVLMVADANGVSASSSRPTNAAAATGLVLTGPSAATAGAAQAVTVTAYDAYGNVATGYTGTVHFTATDPQAALPANYTFAAADAGAHTFTATLKTAGTPAVTATDTSNGALASSASVVVSPAPANRLALAGFVSPTMAGTAQALALTVYDAYGNVATGYTGTVHFTATDPQAALPADYTFTATDAGTHAFIAALKTVGTRSITAADADSYALRTTQANIVITAAAMVRFALNPFPSSWTAGVAQNFTVLAQDAYGNSVPSYAGTVRFSSNDPRALLPAPYTFRAADRGVHAFSATMITAGWHSLTVADANGVSASSSQPTNAAAAASLVLAGPSAAIAGAAQAVTLTAFDVYGNVATGYTGTVHFTSTDAQAALPADYAFTATDAGIHTFSATLKTAGTRAMTVADTANGTLTSAASTAVGPAAASRLSLAGFATATTAGAAQALTVTAQDPYGNVATGYAGTVHFSSTDAQAALPADYTFTSADAGAHTFVAALKTTGAQGLTAADITNGAIFGSGPIAVSPSSASRLAIAGFTTATTAGAAQALTLTAYDVYGNIATAYAGTVHFTSTDAQAALPADYTFTAADAGAHTFTVTLKVSGARAITVADTANGALAGSASTAVSAAAAAGLAVTGPAAATAGAAQAVVVTAYDVYGNIATGYTGTVHFTSADPQAALPADYTFTATDAGTHTVTPAFKTAGAQAVTATDTAHGALAGSASIAVSAAAAAGLVLAGPAANTAGAAQALTLTAYDAYGNVATGYAGTVHFTSTDAQAALPADYTFTTADAGAHTFTAALKTAGAKAVTAADAAHSALASSTTIAVSAAAAASLIVAGPAANTAGAAQPLTLTAYDAYGNVAIGYAGTVHFTSTDAQAALPADYTFTTADAGAHSFTAALKTAGAQAVTAADAVHGALASSTTIAVSAAAAAGLVLAGPAANTAGAAQALTLTAYDVYGNVATGYAGTVHFTSTDAQAALPTDYTFTTADAGAHTFTAALKTAGAQAVTAADAANGALAGSASTAVGPAAAAGLVLAGPAATIAGAARALTLTAYDAYGNVVTGYAGTVHFTATDPRALLPADYTFTATDKGAHTFTATPRTAGAQAVTAADTANGAITGSRSIAVSAAAARRLVLTGYPGSTTAGAAQAVTVTAYDPYGNVATGYTGTVHFTSTDMQAALPADYTFTAADAGAHAFTATLATAGARSVTVADTTNGVLAGSASTAVSPAAAAGLVVAGPSANTAGTAQALTLTAYDVYGNVATGYTGTVHFTTTDPQAALPADYTFTAADAGARTFTVTLKTAGTQALAATDTSASGVTGSGSIAVSPAPAAGLVVAGPSANTAGAAQALTLTACDAYGNVATGYTGTVHFTSTDAQAALPADYTFTTPDAGAHTFTVTLKTAGAQAVTVADTANGAFAGAAPTAVSAAAASRLVLAGLASAATAGAAQAVTVTAYDAYGNVATGYAGTLHFTSTDAQAALPVDYTFTAGDAGAHTFTITPKTAGAQAVTAGDAANGTLIASAPIAISPAGLAGLAVAGLTGATAGAAQAVTVTAVDAYGNTAPGYLGTIHFTSTDAQATLPADYTFAAADASKHTFTATFLTAGAQAVTAADTANGALAGTGSIAVSAAAANRLVLTGLANLTSAGTTQTLTITAYDVYGNVATGYTGTVHFTSTDTQAALPADYTFTAADAGAHVFTTTLKTAGTRSVTTTDTANSALKTTQANMVVAAAAMTHFKLFPFPNSWTAGVAQSFTVLAQDAYGNNVSSYAGTVQFSSTDPRAVLPASYTFRAADKGVHSFSATMIVAGWHILTIADTNGISASFSRPTNAAAAASLVLTAPAAATAGTVQAVTVTAVDAYGNTASTYLGKIHFTSTDAQAVLPANYTFTAADAGVHTFTATLKTAGTPAVSAADTANGAIAGSAPVAVSAAAPANLVVAGPAAATAGVARAFTVTAVDAYGNTAPAYAGIIHFTSTDAQANLPADYAFTTADAGAHTFTATLLTAGARALTATDAANGAFAGSAPVTVAAAAVSRLALAGFTSAATAGAAQALTVIAYDVYGNVATSYLGTVHFTSTDTQATLPADYTFAAADAGVHTFTVVLETAGSRSITAADTVNSALKVTQANITVVAAAAAHFNLYPYPSSWTAGVAQGFTVIAQDPYGNTVPGYAGTVQFSSTDPRAVLPASYTFTAADKGVHSFSATMIVAGWHSLTVGDANGISGSSNRLTNAAAASTLAVAGIPASATAGLAYAVTVTAYDAYGNVATGYAGTVHFSSNDPLALLAADYTFTAADKGVHTFLVTLLTPGTTWLSVTDTVVAGLTGKQSGIQVH